MTAAPATVRNAGRVRQFVGRLLAAVLAGLSALAALFGAGLAMIGLCCGGPALAAAGAGTVAGTAGAVVDGPAVWPFFTAAGVLFAAALLLYRSATRRGCRTSPKRPRSRARMPGTAQAETLEPFANADNTTGAHPWSSGTTPW